jgi:DNA polymerase III subunit epsilon
LNEWLTQVSRIEHTETATAVEAALLETDLIKALNPPYNVSLREREREVWFYSKDLTEAACEPSAEYRFGPFSSRHAFESLNEASLALTSQVFGERLWEDLEDAEIFTEGARRVFPDYPEHRERYSSNGPLIRKGFSLLSKEEPEAKEEEEPTSDSPEPEWTADRVERRLSRTLRYAALGLWRARWAMRMAEMAVAWRSSSEGAWRLLVVEGGAIRDREWISSEEELPVPPGWRRREAERLACFDVATLDRLRVLGTELRKLVSEGGELRGRLSPSRSFATGAAKLRMI